MLALDSEATELIGAIVMLGSVAAVAVVTVRMTSRRDPITNRNAWNPVARVAVVAAVVLATVVVVGSALRVLGFNPEEQSSAEQMREALEAEGLSDDEIDCIEDSFVDDYGSVDDAWDAAQEDARVTLRPLVSCMEVLGMSGEVGECVGDMFVDQYGNGSMGVDEFTEVVEELGPQDRMALSASSLVCQGLPPDIADCVVDAMDAEYPDMFEPERMEPLTAEQQGFMFAAAEDCGY